jgi:HD-GYP domain-containing protein (c-di-GMP phosphodiesterase class II)
LAGKIRDIAKVGLPDLILREEDRLSAGEWELVRQLPALSAEPVSRVPALRSAAGIIRPHHERRDGTGYPEGLAGEAIPLGARILAVSEAYRATLTERPYRPARTPEGVRGEIRRRAGTQFDPRVVDAIATRSSPERRPTPNRTTGRPRWGPLGPRIA